MADIVAFLTKIQDMGSGPLQKLGQSLAGLNNQLNDLQRARVISIDSGEIRKAGREIELLQAKKDKLQNGGSGGGIFKDWMSSLVSGGKYARQAGMDRQTDQTQLQILLGKNNGDKLTTQLEEFAKNSLYGDDAFSAGKGLAGSGMKAQNIMPVMGMIGDIAMGDKDNFKTLAGAFGGASNTGHLTGQQASLMQSAGFNPIAALAATTHKSMPDLQGDPEQGRIGINELVKAMEYTTGPMGRWNNALQKMQETPAGKWTVFTNIIESLAGMIGVKLLPVLGKMADFLTWLMNNTSALYGIAAGIGAMTAAWLVYTSVTKAAAVGTALLEAEVLWPVLLAGAVAGAIAYMCTKYESWGTSIKAIWEITKSVTQLIWVELEGLAEDVEYAFKHIFRNITGGMDWAIVRAIAMIANGHSKQAMEVLDKALSAETKQERKEQRQEDQAHDRFQDYIDQQRTAATDSLSKVWRVNFPKIHFDMKTSAPGVKKITDVFDKVSDFFSGKEAGPSIEPAAKGAADAITGGGVRSLTIHVAKFQDKTEIHSVNMKEGVQELEELLRNMFLRITNSASAMVTAGGV